MKEYRVNVSFKGNMIGIVKAENEKDAYHKAQGNLIEASDRTVEEILEVHEVEALPIRYRIKWTEEREGIFIANSQGTAEWQAFCADESQLTKRTHTVTMVEKLEE